MYDYEVPRHCSFVLLIKIGLGECMAFGSGEGREMRSGARREVEQGLTAFVHNFEF
jgi:hypothetical protein